MNKIFVKIPQALSDEIKIDLRRPHEYAYERVGFVLGSSVEIGKNYWLIIINEYISIPDDMYIDAPEVGAKIDSHAISLAYKVSFSKRRSLFHIHLHDFISGIPNFSSDDMIGIPGIIKSAQSVLPKHIHGMLVFSKDKVNGNVLLPSQDELVDINRISVVGDQINISFPKSPLKKNRGARYSRQSFLGNYSVDLISRIKIGIVGLSGGGSHIVQQSAHLGFKQYVLSDPQKIDPKSNLNRLVGATLEDAKEQVFKFAISQRIINNLHKDAIIQGGHEKWQMFLDQYKTCDIVFGCLDTFSDRRDLEALCRRYSIPYIDIGMDISINSKSPIVYGQVQISIPGKACMKCNGYLSEENLAKEAGKYGIDDLHPQVVWSNGVLASTAVGIAIELITNWTGRITENYYLSYEGHLHKVDNHMKLDHLPKHCNHFPISESGPINYT